MKKATLRFLGSLQDFVDADNGIAEVMFELHPSVKDTFESQGVPHTAVFKVEVNDQKITFDYNLTDGDKITLYPVELIDATEFDEIFSRPLRFIADIHLGKLAEILRLLGLNTKLNKQWNDDELIRRSNGEMRMILSRDLELLKNGDTQFGYWVRATNPDRQIEEVFERFSLSDAVDPFTRCMKCNGLLKTVTLEKVEGEVPPKVKEWHSEFYQCSDCGQVYWKGSHYRKLKERVEELTNISS